MGPVIGCCRHGSDNDRNWPVHDTDGVSEPKTSSGPGRRGRAGVVFIVVCVFALAVIMGIPTMILFHKGREVDRKADLTGFFYMSRRPASRMMPASIRWNMDGTAPVVWPASTTRGWPEM